MVRKTQSEARMGLLEQQVKRGNVDPGKSDRHEIALLAEPGCIGAEIGVDTGQLSERFLGLKHFSSLHCVDKWDDHAHPREQYLAVARKLVKYPEARVWRMTAQEFAMTIPDNTLGFIYIDCYAHTGQDNGEVLQLFWPKLRKGGVFSGDDYDKQTFKLTYDAVNKFAASVGRAINIRDGHIQHATVRMDGHPSWYFYK